MIEIEMYDDFILRGASFRDSLLFPDQYIIHDKANPMPCGHPRGCIVQDEEGTAHCAWCEEVARLREALAKWIHKHRADVASVLHARNEFEGQVYEWYEECCEEVARLREELARLRGDDGHPQLIPDAGMLHRLVYAADMWWEGQGEQSQQDIAAGYALVEKIHAAAGDATDEEEAIVDRA